MKDRCENCYYCHELWYWREEQYPHNKKYGRCCTYLHDTGEDVVMQLFHPDLDLCEAYTPKENSK